jgi:hypothetical protein
MLTRGSIYIETVRKTKITGIESFEKHHDVARVAFRGREERADVSRA